VTRKLIRSPAFTRAVKRVLKKHPQKTTDLQATLELLSKDAFDPRLKSHKLQGDLSGVWACSVGYNLRLLFEFVVDNETEAILLLTAGTHDEVY